MLHVLLNPCMFFCNTYPLFLRTNCLIGPSGDGRYFLDFSVKRVFIIAATSESRPRPVLSMNLIVLCDAAELRADCKLWCNVV